MLYANFINRHYIAEVFAYGKKSYIDRDQRHIGSYDVSFLFVFFDQLWDSLISMRKLYVGLVSAQEIAIYMMGTLPDFYSYLASVARHAIMECVGISPFTEIGINEEFMVNMGDYMAKTETVYCAKKHKDASKLSEWFSGQLWNEYVFGDYSGLDFTGKSFLNTDFRYARFQNSTLVNVTLLGSYLIGASFRNAQMDECRLDLCSIHEADFSGASLKNTSFRNSNGKIGLINRQKWNIAGYLPVVFRNANIKGADFKGANLAGADFSGADLTGSVFTGAELSGADLSGAALAGADFTRAALTGADLTGAKLDGAKLDGAIF
jgi:uncharacterized protein YjbI with pentapeptide repeats